jgi:hypothetical protein
VRAGPIVRAQRATDGISRPLSFAVRRTMSEVASSTPQPASWLTIAKIAAVWLLGCPLAGVALALISGEFGSIGFVVIGLYVGVFGALFHALLSRRRGFLRQSYHLQVLTCATLAATPMLIFFFIAVPIGDHLLGFLQTFALPICGISIAAAWLGAEINYRQSV